jgi:AraC family transcriptional regulator, positive regulator of tynA and feaB
MTEMESAKPIASATARVDIWSTDATRAHERFSYWRDAVCRALYGISIEAPPERFSARIAARSSGALRFATSVSTRYELVRNRRDIDSAPSDHWSFFLQLSGQTVVAIGDGTVELNAGDIGIYDGRQSLRSLHGGSRTIAVVPRAMIERRAPWLRRNPPRKLTAQSRYVDLARRHLIELSAVDANLSEGATSVLTENLCNLIALATAAEIKPHRLQPELQIEALLAFCRQHLHDADLSPQHAADHLGISIRTLHSRFRQIGQSFNRFLLEHRLEACRAALRDENRRSLNISEIAYRWGFSDLSHFNKMFRARFDMTPREWRNGADN